MHLKAKNILVLGDTHSFEYYSLLALFEIKDFILIHVGDSGEENSPSTFSALEALNNYCVNSNGIILTVRGNHSDPAWFKPGHLTEKFTNVKFVPDYTRLKINDREFLFVGGAISIDRKRPHVIEGVNYWKGEPFVLPDNLDSISPCEFLITHSTSSQTPPFGGLGHLSFYTEGDPDLLVELPEERRKIGMLLEKVAPKNHFYGHFHKAHTYELNGGFHRCLDISELIDITTIINE